MFSSCQFLKTEENEAKGEPVARVYESYLYADDIKDIVPSDLRGTDSSSFVQNYINVWAKNQLMVYKAEFNLTEEQKRFEEKINDYRDDLLKYAYLQKYVRERLDTAVTLKAIEEFYSANSQNYLLRENILKFRYLVVPADAPNLEKVEKLFKSEKEEDQKELKEYSLSFARYFSSTDSSWIGFNDFLKLVPVETLDQKEFLTTNKYFMLSAENNLVYFVEIHSFKPKQSPAPLSYVQKVIKNVLINKKRLALINSLEDNLLKDAIKKQEFETY
jgi:hypothetical protein